MSLIIERALTGIGNRHYNGEGSIGSRPPTSIANRELWELQTIKDDFISSPQYQDLIDNDVRGHIRRGAIREFKDSYAYQDALNIAFNRVDRFVGVDEFSRWFAGNLFAHFAWKEISETLNSGQVLLTEDYTAEVCSQIGGRKTKTNGQGIEMGEGTYLPDGILIGVDGKIAAMYEYTLSTDYFKFLNQVKGFRAVKQELNGLSSPETELVFVIPAASKKDLDAMKERINREIRAGGGKDTNFRIEPLGTTRSEFTSFIGRTLNTARAHEELPTLSDAIQEREFFRFISMYPKARRAEFARNIDEMFGGNVEATEYVISHASKYETPVKDTKKVTIVTLPRKTPLSLGEPEFFRKL